MRFPLNVIAILSSIAFEGCTYLGESSWTDRTILPKDKNVPSLNTLANDRQSDRVDRALSIFTLFAQHLRPGFSAVEVHQVLTDTSWTAEAKLFPVTALGGWIPVELNFDDTVFCLHIFPSEEDNRSGGWVIYFRLSGRQKRVLRDEGEALAFLRGDNALPGSPKLVEFALCFPQSETGHRRFERFSRRGIHVYHY